MERLHRAGLPPVLPVLSTTPMTPETLKGNIVCYGNLTLVATEFKGVGGIVVQ